MAIITQQLRLTDSADVVRSLRWRNQDGQAYELLAGRLVIRATELTTPALVDINASLSETGTLATFLIPKATIVAANFEGLANPAVWELILTRADAHTISAVGGAVIWTKGVAW